VTLKIQPQQGDVPAAGLLYDLAALY